MGGKSNFLFRVESSIYIHPKISQLLPLYMLHIEKNILCVIFFAVLQSLSEISIVVVSY